MARKAAQYKDQIQSLKLLQVGGASFPESLARQVPEVINCKLQQVFGMAEGLVNYTRLDDSDEQIFTTQGRPISSDDEIKIVDEQYKEVPEGEIGMLATRGPYTFAVITKALNIIHRSLMRTTITIRAISCSVPLMVIYV